MKVGVREDELYPYYNLGIENSLNCHYEIDLTEEEIAAYHEAQEAFFKIQRMIESKLP